jgi:hypothetical protein
MTNDEMFAEFERCQKLAEQCEGYAVFLEGDEHELAAALLRGMAKELLNQVHLRAATVHELSKTQKVKVHVNGVSGDDVKFTGSVDMPMYPVWSSLTWVTLPAPASWESFGAEVQQITVSRAGMEVWVDNSLIDKFDMTMDEIIEDLVPLGWAIKRRGSSKSEASENA